MINQAKRLLDQVIDKYKRYEEQGAQETEELRQAVKRMREVQEAAKAESDKIHRERERTR